MRRQRQGMEGDPLVLVFEIASGNQHQTRNHIHKLLHTVTDDINEGVRELNWNISISTSSRRRTYKEINPILSVHSVYETKSHINEHHRVAFTRFRVSSHSLAVEMGRWNRRGRGRLPPEERLCACGGQIQTEEHATQHCPFTQHLRDTKLF